MSNPKPTIDPFAQMLAGAVSGLLTSILIHPLDVVRTRMQVHVAGSAYRSTWHGLKTIAQVEGWRALYQGLTPSLVGSGVSWGIFMYWYSFAKSRSTFEAGHLGHMLAAAEAGIVTSCLTNPIWLVKTRLELQQNILAKAAAAAAEASSTSSAPSPSPIASPSLTSPTGRASAATVAPSFTPTTSTTVRPALYRGMLDCMRRVVQEEGVLALYRGLLPSILLCSHGSLQFMMFESVKSMFGVAPTSSQVFISGGVSKIFSTTATFPISTIRARLQQRPSAPGQPLYAGLRDAAQQIWRLEGWRGYFKGLAPCLLRVAPQSALLLMFNEKFAIYFSQLKASLLP